MVRKAASPDDASTSSGNHQGSAVADRKGKRRAVPVDSDDDRAPEATQGIASTQGTFAADDDQKDEEDEEADEEEDEGTPKGRKRARANTAGDAYLSQVDVKGKVKEEVKTLPRDDDGYIPGSIVRVQLKNFVTYDWVEFTPGPYLNMILGPNGTGKSSIACALCLGLNFPPSVLGRASELNSFVKIGTETGHIEIELKGAKGQPNLVIRRSLSARSKSNTFTINGKAASGREINEQMQKLNVQVSNLCSFLPQDKVAEFARMTPQQLLRETQRAAGNSHLTAWHETLIEAGKELKQLHDRMNTDKSQLKTMEERNAMLERDVKKYEERQNLEREIEFLELIIPFKEYSEAKTRYDAAKAAQRTKHERAMKLKAKNAPIEKAIADLRAQQRHLDNQREHKKSTMRTQFEKMKRKWVESEGLENDAEVLKEKLDNLKKTEKNRLKRIENLKKDISAIEHDIANPPQVENIEELTEQIRQRNADIRMGKDKIEEIQQKLRGLVAEESKYKSEVDQNMRRLRDLDNVDHQKLHHLTQWHKDTADTVRWLRDNKQRFKMEIFEPAVLSVTVPDKRYASAVESQFSGNDLQTFVAQCNEDYLLLNQLVADTPEALGRKARINTWFKAPGQPSRQPVAHDELRALGFDGYAIDYVDCPEGMKWFLQNVLNLHRTAISLDPRRVDAARAQDVLSRDGSINYVIGNVLNSVRRSRYGKKLAQNSTRDLAQARHLVIANADPALKSEAERGLNEAQHALQVIREQILEFGGKEKQYRQEHGEKKKQLDGLAQRRKASADKLKAWEGLDFKLKERQRLLQDAMNAPSAEQERTQIKEKILHLIKTRVAIVIDYERRIRHTIADQTESTRFALQSMQMGANINHVQKIFEARTEEATKAMDEYKRADDEYRIAKAEVKHKLDISKTKLDEVSEPTRERFQALEEAGALHDDRSAEQCLVELETLRTQLDMNMMTNAGVVEQFRKRQLEIATLTETIQEREEKLSKLEAKVTKTRGYWEPALRDLVDSIGEKFSAAFDRIGCAGEIKIAEHEDYDKWAIDILVKFRDDEKLQLLTAERQSGGERSLTTILYLMSLTEHARAPFSLVDEINQGMDQRAERAVHNSLVEVTCKADSGQYFLITPKLLPDLNYHERMKVLCVNNGEWIPDEPNTSGNMMGMIDNYLRHSAGASSSS